MVVTAQGGIANRVSLVDQVYRFGVMGFEGNFYSKEDEQFKTLLQTVIASADLNIEATFAAILRATRVAPKAEPTIVQLAVLCSHPKHSAAAWNLLPHVVRNGSHMLTFVAILDQLRGWGRAVKRNIGNWYSAQPQTAYQLLKYPSRTYLGNTWAQRDVLRLAYAKDAAKDELYKYVADGTLPTSGSADADLIRKVASIPSMSEEETIELIKSDYHITWEMVNSEQRTPAIWSALIPTMPAVALLRNMGNFAVMGIDPEIIVERLSGGGMAHPVTILTSWYMYRQGHGNRGSQSWAPNKNVLDALERFFYHSFRLLPKIDNKLIVALDVSSSMTWNSFNGITGLHARTIAAVMAMLHVRTNKDTRVVAFSDTLVDFPMDTSMSLDDVIRQMERTQFGGTHPSLVIKDILDKELDTDSVVMYTDGQTHDSNMAGLMNKVRSRQPLKFVNVAMTANDLSLAYTANDLNLTGFSSDLPAMVNAFLSL